LFEDECSLSNTATVSYAWAPKGCQAQITQKQKNRERATLFGAVNPATGEVVAKQSKKGNAQSFKRFLKKILRFYRRSTGKITVVLDNVKYHRAKSLKPFLEKHKAKLELMFLPPYSPDLNPMERVWWYMRKKITHNRYTETLKDRLKAFWKMFSHYQKPNLEITNICNIAFSV
jgi:transposase